MMINAYANSGPPPRPSTSPVPNFFSSAGAGRKQQFRASQHLQQQQADKLALANSVRNLRPLPPASRNAGGAFGSLMMIEGKTTGEEVQRSTTDRREPPPPPVAEAASSWAVPNGSGVSRAPTPAGAKGSTAATPTADAGEVERQRARVRKLEAELKKALEQNKRKTSDAAVLQAQVDALQTALDNAKSILAEADKAHIARLAAKQAECDELKRARDGLQKQLDDARREADAQRSSLAANNDAKAIAAQEAWAQERTALQSALADSNRQAEAQRRRADLLQTQLDAVRSDLATSQRQVENERIARERSDAVNVARMAELEREAADARAELAQWRERIRQVDSFVLEICQPQFSVVKDESLKPMEVPASRPGSSQRPAGQADAGFVLVPLQLLLQGYALLPKEKKQSIAERYESSKARESSGTY